MTKLPNRKPLRSSISVLAGLLLFLCSISLSSCDLPPSTYQERHLIISVDDAGQCHGVNVATIDALQRGVVTSASIMPACPGFAEFAEFAANHPEHDYGVHLTLTCDMPSQPWGPLSPIEDVSSLVDREGNFWPTWKLVAENVKADEAEAELRAQISRVVESGVRVTHLDHHMFILYSRIDLFQLYVKLALEHQLPIRIARQPGQLGLIPSGDPKWLTAYRQAVRQLTAAGLPLLDTIESRNYSVEPHLKREHHLNTLRNLRPGVTELVVHSAYELPNHENPHNIQGREADTRFLLSEEARSELQFDRIHLTNWKEIKTTTKRESFPRHTMVAKKNRSGGN